MSLPVRIMAAMDSAVAHFTKCLIAVAVAGHTAKALGWF